VNAGKPRHPLDPSTGLRSLHRRIPQRFESLHRPTVDIIVNLLVVIRAHRQHVVESVYKFCRVISVISRSTGLSGADMRDLAAIRETLVATLSN